MAKLKSKRSLLKRIRKTANGYKRSRANSRHILSKEPSKRKRQRRALLLVNRADMKLVKKMLHLD